MSELEEISNHNDLGQQTDGDADFSGSLLNASVAVDDSFTDSLDSRQSPNDESRQQLTNLMSLRQDLMHDLSHLRSYNSPTDLFNAISTLFSDLHQNTEPPLNCLQLEESTSFMHLQGSYTFHTIDIPVTIHDS